MLAMCGVSGLDIGAAFGNRAIRGVSSSYFAVINARQGGDSAIPGL